MGNVFFGFSCIELWAHSLLLCGNLFARLKGEGGVHAPQWLVLGWDHSPPNSFQPFSLLVSATPNVQIVLVADKNLAPSTIVAYLLEVQAYSNQLTKTKGLSKQRAVLRKHLPAQRSTDACCVPQVHPAPFHILGLCISLLLQKQYRDYVRRTPTHAFFFMLFAGCLVWLVHKLEIRTNTPCENKFGETMGRFTLCRRNVACQMKNLMWMLKASGGKRPGLWLGTSVGLEASERKPM